MSPNTDGPGGSDDPNSPDEPDDSDGSDGPDNSDNPDERPNRTPDRPSDHPSGLLEQLRAILETLAEVAEEGNRRGHGRIDRGNAQIDYDYEVSFGLGPRSRRGKPRDEPRVEAPPTEETGSQPEGEKSVHIETRETDDGERIVIADLPGVADDKLDVTLDADESALELRTDEEIVGRVPLDQPNVEITDVKLKNQVLEIRLTRTNESNGSDST